MKGSHHKKKSTAVTSAYANTKAAARSLHSQRSDEEAAVAAGARRTDADALNVHVNANISPKYTNVKARQLNNRSGSQSGSLYTDNFGTPEPSVDERKILNNSTSKGFGGTFHPAGQGSMKGRQHTNVTVTSGGYSDNFVAASDNHVTGSVGGGSAAKSNAYDLRKKKTTVTSQGAKPPSRPKQRGQASKGSVDQNRIVNIQDWYQRQAVTEAESTIEGLRQLNAEKKNANMQGKGVRGIYQKNNRNQMRTNDPSKHHSRSPDLKVAEKKKKGSSQMTELGAVLGPQQINVHQHFDQANILNLNQNVPYYPRKKPDDLVESSGQHSKKSKGASEEAATLSHGRAGRGLKNIGAKTLQIPTPGFSATMPGFNGTSSDAKQAWSGATKEEYNSSKHPRSRAVKHVITNKFANDQRQHRKKQGSKKKLRPPPESVSALPDFKVQNETHLEDAIAMQAKFFNIRHYQQTLLAKAGQLTGDAAIGSRANPYLKNNTDAMLAASVEMKRLDSKSQLAITDKRLKGLSKLEREDLHDQLLLLRNEMNTVAQESTRTKTRCAILVEQIKAKDKFIDELLKTQNSSAGGLDGLSSVARVSHDAGRVHGRDQRPDIKKMAVGQMRVRNQALVQEVQNMRERAIAAEAACALFIVTARKAGVARSLCDVEPRLFKHFEKDLTGAMSRSRSKAAISHHTRSVEKGVTGSRESLTPSRAGRSKSRGQRRRSQDAGNRRSRLGGSTESLIPEERAELERLQEENERLHAIITKRGNVEESTLKQIETLKTDREMLLELDLRKNKIIKKLEDKVKHYQDQIKEMSSKQVEVLKVKPIEDIADRIHREQQMVKMLERRLRNHETPIGSAGQQHRDSRDIKLDELQRRADETQAVANKHKKASKQLLSKLNKKDAEIGVLNARINSSKMESAKAKLIASRHGSRDNSREFSRERSSRKVPDHSSSSVKDMDKHRSRKGSTHDDDAANFETADGPMRSMSHAPEVGERHNSMRVERDGAKDAYLIDKIDQVADESHKYTTEEASLAPTGYRTSYFKESEMYPQVQADDPAVVLGMARLSLLLQVYQYPLDSLDRIILQDDYTPTTNVRLFQLQLLWQSLLQLPEEEAAKFARFLVEEVEEDSIADATVSREEKMVAFDPNRQMLVQYVPVRLMTYFKKLPALYTEDKEKAVTDRFRKHFDDAKIKKLRDAFAEGPSPTIEKAFFKEQVDKMQKGMSSTPRQNPPLSAIDIDCLFVMLVRADKTVDQLEELLPKKALLGSMCRGFDRADFAKMFNIEEPEISATGVPKLQLASINQNSESKSVAKSGRKGSQDRSQGSQRASQKHSKRSVEKMAPEMGNVDVVKTGTDAKQPERSHSKAASRYSQDAQEKGKNDDDGPEEAYQFPDESYDIPAKKEQTPDNKAKKGDETQAQTGDTHKSAAKDNKPAADYEYYDEEEEEVVPAPQQAAPVQKSQPKPAQAVQQKTAADYDEYYDEEEEQPPQPVKAAQQAKAPAQQQQPAQAAEEYGEYYDEEEEPAPKPQPKKQAAPTADYEYYDEEEETQQPAPRKQDVHPVQQPPKQEQAADFEYYDEEEPAEEKKAAQAAPANEEYEYYDEEAPAQTISPQIEGAKQGKMQKYGQQLLLSDQTQGNLRFSQTSSKLGAEKLGELIGVVGTICNRNGNIHKTSSESLLSGSMMESIKLVGTLLHEYADSIITDYPELRESLRDLFREVLYSVYDPSVVDDEWMKAGSNPKGKELEVLLPEDLQMKLENQLNYQCKPEEVQALRTVFGQRQFRSNFLYTDIQEAFKPLGLVDYKTPRGQAASDHLDYEMLDLRSIRLINRMVHYLGSQQISFSQFISGMVTTQSIKTAEGKQDVQLMMAKEFFEKFQKCGLKKNSVPHVNLCVFLCIDKKYKKYLMLKKLKRCIIDFNQSAYFQSVGLKKQRTVEDEMDKENNNQGGGGDDEYGYYDEEEPAAGQQPNQQQALQPTNSSAYNGSPVRQMQQSVHSMQVQPAGQKLEVNSVGMNTAGKQVNAVGSSQNSHLFAANTAGQVQPSAVAEAAAAQEEYEYYDEEI